MAYPHSCPVVSGRSVVKLFIGSFLPFMSSARYKQRSRTDNTGPNGSIAICILSRDFLSKEINTSTSSLD